MTSGGRAATLLAAAVLLLAGCAAPTSQEATLEERKQAALEAALGWLAAEGSGPYAVEAAHAAGRDAARWPSPSTPAVDTIRLGMEPSLVDLRAHLALAMGPHDPHKVPVRGQAIDVLARVRAIHDEVLGAVSVAAPSFQLLALHAAGVPPSDGDVGDLVFLVHAKQHAQGGWGCGGRPNVDCTGFAIAALAAAGALDDLSPAERQGIHALLDASRGPDGGYGNTQSTAWALAARHHLGAPQEPRAWEYLLARQREDGSFGCDARGTACVAAMATAEAVVALSGFHPVER